MIKRFLDWIGIKVKLDTYDHEPPFLREGDLWWCAVGENIGVEVSGKSRDFTRPVIVLKNMDVTASWAFQPALRPESVPGM